MFLVLINQKLTPIQSEGFNSSDSRRFSLLTIFRSFWAFQSGIYLVIFVGSLLEWLYPSDTNELLSNTAMCFFSLNFFSIVCAFVGSHTLWKPLLTRFLHLISTLLWGASLLLLFISAEKKEGEKDSNTSKKDSILEILGVAIIIFYLCTHSLILSLFYRFFLLRNQFMQEKGNFDEIDSINTDVTMIREEDSKKDYYLEII
ncbi:unnamed protein product, partial [Mesorhabditis belari]|uniref:Uncharacterized protein n=1 Tax=Mesorhabditis belari TaxID=2138241 RepID=A0AAF3F9L0_9BILA